MLSISPDFSPNHLQKYEYNLKLKNICRKKHFKVQFCQYMLPVWLLAQCLIDLK